MWRRSLGLAFLLSIAACGSAGSDAECEALTMDECREPDAGMPLESELVVDAAWLSERLGDPDVQPVDARGSAFSASRIPDAISLAPGDLSRTIDGVPGQLLPAEEAEPILRAAGLKNGVIAIVYGASPEYNPARIVWALRYYGHSDVRYLDGGFSAWVEAGGEVEGEPPNVVASEYDLGPVVEPLRVTGDWVLEQLGAPPYDMPAIQLVDARSEGEYEGGHIPSARSVNWTRNLSGGFLRPDSELQALYEGLDPRVTTVTYCASGQRGSFAWLSLTALGFEDVRLYDGSWNEWSPGNYPTE
jgi:thiosulfate/3-mercaptopyruvate sulfurtransferase